MQSNFPSPVLDFTLTYEGGWSDDPRDPGGATMEGVTQRTYDAFRAAHGLAPQSVRGLSAAERDTIYRDGYWSAIGAADLPDGVDLAAFDLAVNSGPARARTYLKATPPADPAVAVEALCRRRLSFLHALSTWEVFGKGWAARVAACEALALKMALNARYGAKPSAPPAKGVAAQLARRSDAASATASRRSAGGAASGLAGAAAAPAAAAAPSHAAVVVLLLVCVAAAILAAFLAWRGGLHRARAAALAASAQG